ncbi:hypothetical protein KO566_07795 [Flavobacteriaceae bacterium XHP0103]|uniref:hypothetical protein n=1 Tax=Marixanthotalea marina TaxID=2844359 RepID=UPI002989CE69|nr:hypothetical protein [Marixanthotalea marina]MBU3821958.1 hypothetical protein [Marixanthotalea marina]
MKKSIYILAIFTFILYGCTENNPDEISINYISFESTSYDFGVDIGGSNNNDIKVYTTTISSSERIFNINILTELSTADPNSFTVPNSVIVPANTNFGSFSVNISDTNISPNGETLTIAFTDTEGLLIGDPITLNIQQICPYPETFLNITFDDYPEEQYWELYDDNGMLLFSGGPYPDETEFSKAFCLAPGNYTIFMGDGYGDGGGPYTITYNGSVIVSRNGDHGLGEEISFIID